MKEIKRSIQIIANRKYMTVKIIYIYFKANSVHN